MARSSPVHAVAMSTALSVLCLGLLMVGGCPWCPTQTCDPNEVCDPNEICDPNEVCDPNEICPDDSAKPTHEKIFSDIITSGYEGPQSCLVCHSDVARDLLETGHWNWQGEVANIEGLEGETHGKIDLINNLCIAVPSNEGRCSACHPSYGWVDNTFDFDSVDNIDCLICHDTTGTYAKHPTATGGGGDAAIRDNGTVTPATLAQLQPIAYGVGAPTRKACGECHFYAGGGNNVKHGDLSTALIEPTFAMDVHMDAAGLNFNCQRCHTEEDHGIAGMPLHSVNEGGASPDCTRCHGESPHAGGVIGSSLNLHTDRVACQTCHIPTFSRQMPTKVEWYWEDAGQDIDPLPTDEFGKATYDKKKGSFVWAQNVKPTLMWYDGKWQRKVINVTDTYTEAATAADPIVIAAPTATIDTDGAKLYPFKKMIGNQPVDTVNQRLVVPHLFGTATGPNPYWVNFDWDLAIQDGTTYAGQPYSGTFGFGNTVMYLTVNHEIAPASQALVCEDCHGVDGFFEALGYDGDPAQ